jgi:hypothetical protein
LEGNVASWLREIRLSRTAAWRNARTDVMIQKTLPLLEATK